jgi:hypothetical protein
MQMPFAEHVPLTMPGLGQIAFVRRLVGHGKIFCFHAHSNNLQMETDRP